MCSFCGTHAAQRVVKQQQRFSLFFIPLFSFSTKYLTTCTACGRTARISQDPDRPMRGARSRNEAGVLTGV